MKKRVISFLLCLLMPLALLPGFALAEETQTDEVAAEAALDGAVRNGWVKGYGNDICSDGRQRPQWFYYVNGTVQSGWQKIDGKWYYFYEGNEAGSGNMARFERVGQYLLDQTGAMVENDWFSFPGRSYVKDKDGNYTTVYDGTYKWYYCGAGGKIVTGTAVIGGTTYTFDADGALIGERQA